MNPCVWTHCVLFSESSTVVHAKGGQVHFPWLVVVFGVRGNEWFGCLEGMNVHSTSPSPPKEMNGL